MAVKASYTITLVRVDDGTDATLQSATAPSDKTKLWCDTSVTPPTLKRWDGTKWTIVNDYTENISTAKKEVTEEYTSAINIVKNEINQNVSKLDTTVYKFETGSGNIFDNCNQYVSKNSSSSKEIMSYDMPFGLDLDTLRNKDICISTEVFARKSIPKSLLGYMGAEFTITFTDNTTQKIATYFMPSTFYLQYYSESGTNEIDQRIYTHYKVLDKAIKLVSNMKIIIAINGESLRVANPKVEFGVYPTGFEFDMHDMRDSVTTIESNYTKMDMKIDSISLQAVSLTQEVTSIKGNVSTLETRLQSTELKLTPTNITAMVNEKIGSDGSIKTTKVTIDKTGLSVYGGGMAIYNNANQKVFYADVNGNMVAKNASFSGDITSSIITGNSTINVGTDLNVGNNIYLNSNSSYSYKKIEAGQGASIDFSYSAEDKARYIYINSRISNSENHSAIVVGCGGYNDGVNINDFKNNKNIYFDMSAGEITLSGDTLNLSGNTRVSGDFFVIGTKNRIVKTENYGNRLLNAVESTTAIFEDNGNGCINTEGYCTIFFNEIFLQTINTKCDYFVQLTKKNQGDLWCSDKTENYFIVEGLPGTKFDWNVKAKQRDYETSNLDIAKDYDAQTRINNEAKNQDEMLDRKLKESLTSQTTFESEVVGYYESYMKEQEVTYE